MSSLIIAYLSKGDGCIVYDSSEMSLAQYMYASMDDCLSDTDAHALTVNHQSCMESEERDHKYYYEIVTYINTALLPHNLRPLNPP